MMILTGPFGGITWPLPSLMRLDIQMRHLCISLEAVIMMGNCYENLKLENKGIVFKARWFVRPDINTARPLFKWNDEGIARVVSRKNNGHV